MVGMAPVAAVPHMYSPLRYLTPVAREVRIIAIITMLIIVIITTRLTRHQVERRCGTILF